MRIATGQHGELRCGYQWAATLGAWAIDLNDEMAGDTPCWSCSAVLTDYDEYWLEHGNGFGLRLTVGKRIWRWSEVAMKVDGRHVAIKGTGKPEIV